MILLRLIPDFSCISHTHDGSSMRKSQKDIFETQWAGFRGAKSLNYCYGKRYIPACSGSVPRGYDMFYGGFP